MTISIQMISSEAFSRSFLCVYIMMFLCIFRLERDLLKKSYPSTITVPTNLSFCKWVSERQNIISILSMSYMILMQTFISKEVVKLTCKKINTAWHQNELSFIFRTQSSTTQLNSCWQHNWTIPLVAQRCPVVGARFFVLWK